MVEFESPRTSLSAPCSSVLEKVSRVLRSMWTPPRISSVKARREREACEPWRRTVSVDYVHIAFASPVCVRMSCEGQRQPSHINQAQKFLARIQSGKSLFDRGNPGRKMFEEGKPASKEGIEGSTRVAPTRQGATCKGLKSCIDMTQSDGALY